MFFHAGKIANADRRSFLRSGAHAALGLPAAFAGAPLLARRKSLEDLSEEDLFRAYIKLIGTLVSGEVYIWFSGVLWGVLPKAPPVPFCRFHGLAKHRWEALGEGRHIQRQYDVGFFSDLETDQPIDKLVNPITGETVEVYHNKYGGFAVEHDFAKFAAPDPLGLSKMDRLKWEVAGAQVTLKELATGSVPTRLPPDAWPRETSGPVNHYGSETSYTAQLDQLLDTGVTQADYSLGWLSIAPWEPWLLMDSAAGTCQWNATGFKLRSYQEAPAHVLDFVAKEQPNYFEKSDPWDGILNAVESFKLDREPAS